MAVLPSFSFRIEGLFPPSLPTALNSPRLAVGWKNPLNQDHSTFQAEPCIWLLADTGVWCSSAFAWTCNNSEGPSELQRSSWGELRKRNISLFLILFSSLPYSVNLKSICQPSSCMLTLPQSVSQGPTHKNDWLWDYREVGKCEVSILKDSPVDPNVLTPQVVILPFLCKGSTESMDLLWRALPSHPEVCLARSGLPSH